MLPKNRFLKNLIISKSASVIYLKERSFHMLKKDLILRNPLRLLGYETDDILPKGGFGAVLARAGVGKTSLLVQLALNTLLRSKNVLHISLVDSVKKVNLRYEEVFKNITNQYHLEKTDELWESILPHRFIMTFKVEGFSVPKLEERLSDLTEQGIFFPDMVLIDGLPFDGESRQPRPNGMPSPLIDISDLFDIAIHLKPEGDEIHVKALRGGFSDTDRPLLFLDPSTMLIKDKK